MITLKFTDTDVKHSNPKSARGWLRKNGMNVKQCTKQGEVWVFDFPLDDKVTYKPRAKTGRLSGSDKPQTVTMQNPTHDGGATLKQIELLEPQTPKLHKPKGPINNEPVKGKDLLPGDVIMNFAEYYDLTVDHRGVHEIVIPAPNITREENRYTGFYSFESGGTLSYRVELEAIYDVKRGEV